MASNKSLNPTFNWGDSVIIKESAPKNYNPGYIGCICGMREIESTEEAKEFDVEISTKLYLIEFDDGNSIEIPGYFISLIS